MLSVIALGMLLCCGNVAMALGGGTGAAEVLGSGIIRLRDKQSDERTNDLEQQIPKIIRIIIILAVAIGIFNFIFRVQQEQPIMTSRKMTEPGRRR